MLNSLFSGFDLILRVKIFAPKKKY